MDKDQRLNQLARRLREHGYRMTHQRMAVLKELLRSDRHPSAEEIYQELEPAYPMMSRATIYKTLATLKELGEVLELEFGDGRNHYDAFIPQPHPHLVCLHCARIEDYAIAELAQLTAAAEAHTGYRLLSPRLDFYGICWECSDTSAYTARKRIVGR